MVKVIINSHTRQMIRAAAKGPFKSSERRLGDDRWEIDLEESTLARITARMLPGETIDACIERVFHTQSGLN